MGFESGAGEFMQNSAVGTYSAAQMRRSTFAWAARAGTTIGSAIANTPGAIAGGLFSATDMQLSAAVSGLIVYTSTGDCLIPGQEANNQGGYHGFLSSQNSTTLATANGSNPRIDAIVATSGDPQYTIPTGGTSGYVTIQGVTGTPTSGATLSNLSGAPTVPLSSLLLGYVLVPAAATSLSSADIANKATTVGQLAGVHHNGDYVLGATGVAPGIARGFSAFLGNASTSVQFTVAHGLGATPAGVGVSAVGWVGYACEYQAPNATDLYFESTLPGSTFASGTTYYLHWTAIL